MTIDINMIHLFAFISLILFCLRAIKDNAKEISGYLFLKGHNFSEYVFKIKAKIVLYFAFIICDSVILYQSLFYVFWYMEQFLKNICEGSYGDLMSFPPVDALLCHIYNQPKDLEKIKETIKIQNEKFNNIMSKV